jgi:GMP synthase-like glutamine amidotransferase
MDPVLIVTHVDHEGPGYLAEVLARHAVPYRVISIDRGDTIPERPHGLSGLVSMGGPMSVNDPLPWIPRELSLLRAAVDAGLPVLGHCLGGQLISKALGGAVTRNRIKEIGWFDVQSTDNGAVSPWLRDLPRAFAAFHWHGETFSIPPGGIRLLENGNCENQAFALDSALAFQCHIEMTENLVHDWIARAPEEFAHTGTAVQTPGDITHHLSQRIRDLHRVADVVYDRWVEIAIRRAKK